MQMQSSGNRPLDELDKREQIIEILKSDVVQSVIEKTSRTAIEHVLVRFGFRTEGVNELQADMNFMREFRTRIWPEVSNKMENMERALLAEAGKQSMHEAICGERYKKISDTQDMIAKNMRWATIFFILTCVGAIGFLVKITLFPGG